MHKNRLIIWGTIVLIIGIIGFFLVNYFEEEAENAKNRPPVEYFLFPEKVESDIKTARASAEFFEIASPILLFVGGVLIICGTIRSTREVNVQNPPKDEKSTSNDQTLVICDNCGANVTDTQIYCHSCGARFI